MKRVLCVWLPNWPHQRRGGNPQAPDLLADRQALLRLAQWCEQFSPSVGLDESLPPESLFLDATGVGPLFGGEAGLLKYLDRQFTHRGLKHRAALSDTIGAAWALAHYAAQPGPQVEWLAPHVLLAAAGQSPAALAPLPVEALRLSLPTLQVLGELGLNQIGQLALFSRDALATRFPADLLLRLDQADGRLAEPIHVQQPPPQARADWTFQQPIDRLQPLQAALDGLIERLSGQLAQQRHGAQHLQCTLHCLGGEHVHLPISLFRPTAVPRHLIELAALQMEQVRLTQPVTSIEVIITATAPLECRQQELFDISADHYDPRPLALLVDRLCGRLGRAAVVRPTLLPEVQPEYACRYQPIIAGPRPAAARPGSAGRGSAGRGKALLAGTAGSCRASAQPAPRQQRKPRPQPPYVPEAASLSRPLSLCRPEPLDVLSIVPDGPPLAFRWSGREHRIHRHWGPERIQTGWWRGRSVHRDYYRIETSIGQWFWLFRQLGSGTWYLHGTFD